MGTARWKRGAGQGTWGSGRASMSLQIHPSPQISTCYITQKLSKPHSFGFLQRLHYIIEWIIGHYEAIQPPAFSLPQRSGVGLKNHMIQSPGHQPPSLSDSQQSPHQDNKDSFCSHDLGNPQGFRSCARNQDEDQIYTFPIINHNVISPYINLTVFSVPLLFVLQGTK